MAFDKETAARLESLYQQHLDEAFQGTFTFDPITVEVSQNIFEHDAFHVTVAYNGDVRLLDPAKMNRISSLMIDEAAELGIENTILESYVDSREYAGQVDRVEEPLEETGGNQSWHKMLNIARRFLNIQSLPNEAELSLGIDRCYFAMYHALCHSNARALAAGPRQQRREDWSRVYMGMDESAITARLRHYRPHASDEVKDFDATFAILQEHRDRAMEPPNSTFLPSEVARLIQRVESAIIALESPARMNVARWLSTCWLETCMARVPASSPHRTPTGLPLDDARGRAKDPPPETPTCWRKFALPGPW